MSKSSLLLLLGGLVVFVSLLGIPSSWKTIIFGVLGVSVIIIALLLRRDIATGALCMNLTEERHTNSYKQNGALHSKNNTVNSNKKKEEKKADSLDAKTVEVTKTMPHVDTQQKENE